MRKTKLLSGLLVIVMSATVAFSTVRPVKAAENSGEEIEEAVISAEGKGAVEDVDVRLHIEGQKDIREIADEYKDAINSAGTANTNGKVNILSKDATYSFEVKEFDETKYYFDEVWLVAYSFERDESGKLILDRDSIIEYDDISLEGINDFTSIPDSILESKMFTLYFWYNFWVGEELYNGWISWDIIFNDTETSPVQFKDDSTGRTVPYYSITDNGGNWNGSQYYLEDGTLVKDAFFFDGSYTYYLQADGTPMCDCLTYHPDGEHIIYLDSNGHEVFNNFQYCPSVGYTCYFDSQGYLYKDQITFVGDKAYYLNANGAMENNGWFQFANGMDYGFANWDGTLNTNGFSYDPWGRIVFYHWNGMVARGLITDGVWYYSMDTTDGHYLGSFPVN